MSATLRRITTFRFGPALFPVFLLALCLAAYAPLITRLGFYWDDFPISWIASTMGGEGLERYFSTNRPVWGMVYRLTTPLLGSQPLTWQVAALALRWGTGLAFWWLLRLVWPGKERFAAWAAAIFVVYPGFSQQFIAFLYSHFFIILTAYLLSLALMVLALRNPRWFWPLTVGSLLLSLLNLFAMEYFFLLDLLRPLLAWVVLGQCGEYSPRERIKKTVIVWLPYLAVFAGAMFWRSVLFGFQTYQPTLMSELKSQPVQALQKLVPLVLRDVWKTSAGAWVKAFTLPSVALMGERNVLRYWMIVALGGLLSLGFLLLYRPHEQEHRPGLASRAWAIQPAALGVIALFIAGGPFWLTALQIGLVFPNDRFTLPFMLGAALLTAGLLELLPLPRWIAPALLSVGLGFAVGLQYQNAVDYSRDWSVQRNLIWQMVWRIPDLQPGTTLLINELPVTHYTDNSLTAPVNWTYDPNNDPLELDYVLFYPTLRKYSVLSGYQAGQPVELDYLAAQFQGSTDKMVTLYFNPPACLRVLDAEVERDNWMVPEYLRETLPHVTTAPILPEPAPGKQVAAPPRHIYDEEINRGWCYYYEQADLARQVGDWESVVALGEQALAGNDYPNDPAERFPFIEGYAHTGDWERAVQLNRETQSITPLMTEPLCRLWERIERETPAGAEQQQALQSVRADLGCRPVTTPKSGGTP